MATDTEKLNLLTLKGTLRKTDIELLEVNETCKQLISQQKKGGLSSVSSTYRHMFFDKVVGGFHVNVARDLVNQYAS